MNDSLISVVIPIYNTALYIEKGVASALEQPEVAEVVLVDDGSTDGSTELCQRLSQQSPRVNFYQHPGGVNRGISATRNLGIRNSQFPLIAFLDSDDYFLPGAFQLSSAKLQDKAIDGVYGMVQVVTIADDQTVVETKVPTLIGIKADVPPEDLFSVLVNGRLNSFHANSLVIRRSLLEKTGLFDETLILKEDVELWIRMAALGTLVSGDLEHPVAMHTVHATRSMNRMSNVLPAMNKKYRLGLLKWLRETLPGDREKIRLMEIRVAAEYLKSDRLFVLFRPFHALGLFFYLFLQHQRILFNIEVWKLVIKDSFQFLFQ